MIELQNNSTVFILAPANSASGGQEALHELGHYLIKENISAKMAYYRFDTEKSSPVPEKFLPYGVPHCLAEEIPDSAEHILFCPEAASEQLDRFTHIRKAMWWLSVGFYVSSIRNTSLLKLTTSLLQGKFSRVSEILKRRKKMFRFNNSEIMHFTGSYYTFDYVTKRGGNPHLLIQPLGIDFLNKVLSSPPLDFSSENRSDVILYNPSKGSREMTQLMKRYPTLPLVPLKGFTPDELIERMKTAKLYIDFGKFPGPERLPKEAVVNGCCILTGRRGASNFHGDVRIPDQYKISSGNIEEIHSAITDILDNYDNHIANFQEYRQMVYDLEQNFRTQISDYFKQK